jgi:hypothetical protein
VPKIINLLSIFEFASFCLRSDLRFSDAGTRNVAACMNFVSYDPDWVFGRRDVIVPLIIERRV